MLCLLRAHLTKARALARVQWKQTSPLLLHFSVSLAVGKGKDQRQKAAAPRVEAINDILWPREAGLDDPWTSTRHRLWIEL